MNNTLRLHYFEWTTGNAVGLRVLARQLGWFSAMQLAGALQWRLAFQNPFKKMNRQQTPDRNALLSQRQMAPLVVLYRLLQEQGHDEVSTLALLRELSAAVAIEFLKFNVPRIDRQRFAAQTRDKKLQTLKNVTQRFFNADADLTLSADDSFSFTVKSCHFANYSRQLNVAQLGPLFCDADRQYFEQFQPDVVFFRSTTLASNNRACDFCFRWREHTHKEDGFNTV